MMVMSNWVNEVNGNIQDIVIGYKALEKVTKRTEVE
jgi:hypothetical protein